MGYSHACFPPPTPEERDALVFSVEQVTLELCMRFATDALEETYFSWDKNKFSRASEHNLVRAKNQYRLFMMLESSREERRELVHRIFP